MSFEDFLRAAQERAAQPQAPTYAERLRALNEELRDPLEGRRVKLETLAAQGATEGERAAARAALERLDAPSHAEIEAMQRGGNWIDE